MKSIYEGRHINKKTSLHTIQFFDGQHTREVELMTNGGKICWTERVIPGILEIGIDYKTAKRRVAALEKQSTMRIG